MPHQGHLAAERINAIVREEWGRVLAILVAGTNDFHLAEDALQDALVAALEHWGASGLPERPAAWLLKVARRKLIDQVRRRANFHAKTELIQTHLEARPAAADLEQADIPDERLRLMFTCCHPALARPHRVALTLQALGGLTTPEIARAFLVPEPTMAQRLVRSKRKIKAANIPFHIPGAADIDERIDGILEVLYLIFNEGHSATSGEDALRVDLCEEAIRLARTLAELAPAHPETAGLLALLVLHHARACTRTDARGDLVLLEDQDRSKWNRDLIAEGTTLLDATLAKQQPGPYQIQAAISALHAAAPSHLETDWPQIELLYHALHKFRPGPIVRLNGLVARSYAQSPEVALDALSELAADLSDYLPFHLARADLSRRARRGADARSAYERALGLGPNRSQRRFIERRIDALDNQ